MQPGMGTRGGARAVASVRSGPSSGSDRALLGLEAPVTISVPAEEKAGR